MIERGKIVDADDLILADVTEHTDLLLGGRFEWVGNDKPTSDLSNGQYWIRTIYYGTLTISGRRPRPRS